MKSVATGTTMPAECKFGSPGSADGRILAFRWHDIHMAVAGFVSRRKRICKCRAMSIRSLDLHHNPRRTHRVVTRRAGFGGGPQVDQLLLTPEDAAELLAVGRTKLYELLRTGALESVRIGAARRIPASALTAYVERLRRDEAADADGYRGMVS